MGIPQTPYWTFRIEFYETRFRIDKPNRFKDTEDRRMSTQINKLEAVDLCSNIIQQCIGSHTMTKANATLLA